MSSENARQWLVLLQETCTRLGSPHLDLLIDQTGCQEDLPTGIGQLEPPMPFRLLFEGMPEEGISHLGPLLIRIEMAQSLHRFWLEELIEAFVGDSRLLALVSPWPFERLAGYLQQCLEAANGGVVGVLRFYDPRLFPLLLSHVLDPQQQSQLLRPALCWSWLDRNGQPCYQRGEGASAATPDVFQPIELSDDQMHRLGCASDATVTMGKLAAELPAQWQAEQRFQACYAAMLEADAAGLLTSAQRTAFVRDRVHGG
ncbi:MAG: DUF4123 domain-containing protein [Paucimonas sp.]|jgi:hypothetical protein|nr:DUF4123 domain-containing protein [Paucimonas sp.]